jgi:phosphoglycolate phosphatase-like HAD superfamily hydrolase
MDFKHVIWDFDGTLYDTYQHTARALQIFLKREYMVNENVLEIERQMRISMNEAYVYYKEKFEINENFWKNFMDYRIIYENQNAIPYNNAHMICKFIYEQGSLNHLLTHRDSAVFSMMQKHGFYELFKGFVTKENGFSRKPSPDGLNYLVNKYNMNKDETLYIGDREIDLQCARNAGVKFCLFTEDVNQTFGADFSVQNFSDFYYILNSSLSTR